MNTITIIAIATGIIAVLAWFAINYIEHGKEAVSFAMLEHVEDERPAIEPMPSSFADDVKAQLDVIRSMYTLGKIDRDVYLSLTETMNRMAENVADEHLRALEERVA